jgi:hypothetical protein
MQTLDPDARSAQLDLAADPLKATAAILSETELVSVHPSNLIDTLWTWADRLDNESEL